MYLGAFDCWLGADPSSTPKVPDGSGQFTGPIMFKFEKSADGEFLVLSNAKLAGNANGAIDFGGDVIGMLDCNSLAFTATISNGYYDSGGFASGMLVGMLSGTLDPKTGQLTGSWSLSSPDGTDLGIGTCDGPWQAVLTP
jgi:hypothetical protein